MKTIYQSTITEIGADVDMFLEEKMMIIFNESAPQELRDIAILHSIAPLEGQITVGDELVFDEQTYKVTFVGELVNETVSDFGHCTISFNGADHADLPGTLCVEEKEMPTISISTKIAIKTTREA